MKSNPQDSHTTHYACDEQLGKGGCCCTGHKCKPQDKEVDIKDWIKGMYYRGLDQLGLSDTELDDFHTFLDHHYRKKITAELLEKMPEANPEEWAGNQPQVAWTLGYKNALKQFKQLIKEINAPKGKDSV